MAHALSHSSLLRDKLDGQVFASSKWALPGYALFFLMLFAPTVYQPIKIGLISIVLIVIMFKVYRLGGRLPVHPHIAMWSWFLSAVGLFFVIRGLTLGAPGAIRVTTVYVIYPLLFLIFVAGAASAELLRGLIRTLTVAALAIGVYTFQFILTTMGILPQSLYIELDLGQAIEFYAGFVEFNTWAVATLLFLVPFAAAALMVWPDKKALAAQPDAPHMPVARVWLWIMLLLGLLLVLLSGRRALLLCVMLAPFITLILQRFLATQHRVSVKQVTSRALRGLIVVTVAGFFYLQAQYDIDLVAMWEMFISGFSSASSLEGGIRTEQFRDLITAWSEVPFLGGGHGASADAIRIARDRWSYELQYAALLYHVGLIGFACYAAGTLWIYHMALRVIRAGTTLSLYMLPILVGTTAFLLAQATNPYLGKYDFIWVIFLPLIPINLYLRGTRV